MKSATKRNCKGKTGQEIKNQLQSDHQLTEKKKESPLFHHHYAGGRMKRLVSPFVPHHLHVFSTCDDGGVFTLLIASRSQDVTAWLPVLSDK